MTDCSNGHMAECAHPCSALSRRASLPPGRRVTSACTQHPSLLPRRACTACCGTRHFEGATLPTTRFRLYIEPCVAAGLDITACWRRTASCCAHCCGCACWLWFCKCLATICVDWLAGGSFLSCIRDSQVLPAVLSALPCSCLH
jgi:hypothetical protein